MQIQSLDPEVRHLGKSLASFRADADPDDNCDLRTLLVGAIRWAGGDVSDISDYELIVRPTGSSDIKATFGATR